MDIQHLQQLPVEALVAIAAGILVLLVPRILNYTVATYLLVVGVLGLLHFWYGHTIRPQAVVALVAGILILVKPAILNYVVGIYQLLTLPNKSAYLPHPAAKAKPTNRPVLL